MNLSFGRKALRNALKFKLQKNEIGRAFAECQRQGLTARDVMFTKAQIAKIEKAPKKKHQKAVYAAKYVARPNKQKKSPINRIEAKEVAK